MYLRVNQDLKELQSICICPTRELINQAKETFEKIFESKPLIVGCVGRDFPEPPRDVQVIFGTPAGVHRFIRNGDDKINLNHVKFLAIDEADQILDHTSTFCRNSWEIIKKIQDEKAQISCFSATYPNNIKKRLLNGGYDFAEITLQRRSDQDILALTHVFMRVNPENVDNDLIKILNTIETGSFYVFVSSKEKTKQYAELLSKNGFAAGTLTSDMSGKDRDDTIDKFKKGEIKALVTTNAFSRGIDNPDATYVFSIDLPKPKNFPRKRDIKGSSKWIPDIDMYVHRSGRAARFGKKGVSFTFVKNEHDMWTIRNVSRKTGIVFREMKEEDIKTVKPTEAKEVVMTEQNEEPPEGK